MSAAGQIKSYFDRWQRLEEAKAEIGEDLKDLFAEAKSFGHDTKAMRVAFRGKVKDDERTPDDEAFDAVVETYRSALDVPRAHPAHSAREIIEEFPAAKGATNGGTDPLNVGRTNHEQRHEARVPSADGRGEGADESAQGQGSGTPGTDRHGGPVAGTFAGENEDGRSGHVGREARHEVADPETGEILESVQSHEALGPSAPAESASGEISATNQPETAGLPQSEKSEGDGLRDRQHVHSRQTGEAKHGGQDGHAAAPDHAPHSNPQASSSQQADKAEAPSSSPDASAVNSEPTFAARPKSLTKPLCRYPGEDRCAGYGSVTCHACLRAAREDEVAA